MGALFMMQLRHIKLGIHYLFLVNNFECYKNINKYQAETIKWRDRKVRLKNIEPGHLVLRRVANPETVGKLQLKWEGPFLVVSSSRPGSYRLKDMDGNDIPRSWNADELRRYYV
jgi:hypothetical protein